MSDICGLLLEEKSDSTNEPRKMPSNYSIRNFWSKVDGFPELMGFDCVEEFIEDDYCFACGLLGFKTERAHILAKTLGGSDLCSNLHLLCSTCHKDSEYIDGEDYKRWLIERTPEDVAMSRGFRMGKNFASLLRGIK